MKLFESFGPFKIPLEKGKGGRYVVNGCLKFWEQHPGLSEERGVYVFAIRAAKGLRPVYVGKATKSFRRECFASHKIANHYDPEIAKIGKGTPVMFLLVAPGKESQTQRRLITQAERFLIGLAQLKNPKLSNVQGKKPPAWGIKGVLRPGQGKPSGSALKLRSLLRL
jgi:hypothetical protein